jgi:hypothetical protein
MTSQINPNNIDGEYPVAGVSNNTQGMRDNFTNIKTNFQYAEDEINDLQSKVLLKSALTGTTLDNNMADNLIYAAKIQDFSATQVQLVATSGVIAIDYSAGHYQTLSMVGNVSLNFTNFPAAGSVGMLRIQVTVGTAGLTLTLPAAVSVGTTGVQGYSASVITFAAAGTFEFGFVTSNAGTTITLFDLNRPLSYYTNPVTIASTTVSSSSGTGALVVGGGVGIAGNLYVSGNIVGSLVATGNTFAGNTTVGNLLTAGFVSATGNVTGGNINTGAQVVATGNITGGNLNATGLSLSGNVVSAINLTANITTTANIQAGNLKSSGIMSATANVTGGNILTANVNATTHTGTTVSVSGNITGGNVLSGAVVSAVGAATILSGTAVPAGGTTGAGYKFSSVANLGVFFGSGAPTLSAAQGSLYLRTDGSTTNDRMYVNTNGSTTWTAVTTAA